MAESSRPTRFGTSDILRRLSGVVLLSVLLAGLALGWLLTSNAGARFGLDLLERFTGLHSVGISGSLDQRLHIRHIELRVKQLELSADEVELQWQPGALLQRKIQIDYLRADKLKLALPADDGQPGALPRSLALPGPVRLVSIKELSIRQAELSTLEANHQHSHVQQFSGLAASVSGDATNYAVQFSGSTPWGYAAIKGTVGSLAPFNIQAHFDGQGLAVRQHSAILPRTRVQGTLTGNLARLHLQAALEDANQAQGARGQIHAVITPFSVLPVDTLQLDFAGVNPASFYVSAPSARLKIKADLKVGADQSGSILSGHVGVVNDMPSAWNAGGIPALQVSADLTLSEHQISWKSARIELEQGGVAWGDGVFVFASAAAIGQDRQALVLPEVSARLDLANVNLLRIDSRLKKTRLNGRIEANNKNRELNFSLNLQEADPDLNARLRAELRLNNQLSLNLQQLEVQAKDATLALQGSLDLKNSQVFALQGEAHHFNPARWIAVPDGRLATRFTLAGQLQRPWRIDAQLSELSGRFAGLDLHGVSDFHIQQDQLLAIKKLDLSWGKNHLSANGNWSLGAQTNRNQQENLQFSVALPDLAAVSRPFEKVFPVSLQGAVFAEALLSGNASQPSGRITVRADQVAVPDAIYLNHMQADLLLAQGGQGKFEGRLDLAGLSAGGPDSLSADDGRLKVLQLRAELSGTRHGHSLQVSAALPQGQSVTLQAGGDLQEASQGLGHLARWAGQVTALNLSGPLDFQLLAPFNLAASTAAAQMSRASWQGKLGRLHVEQVEWAQGQLTTSGQFQEIPVARILKLLRADAPLNGDLLLDGRWRLNVGQHISGQIQIQRASGDLAVLDVASGHSQSLALGLQQLMLSADFGDSAEPSQQQITAHIQAAGNQLGLIEAKVVTHLTRSGQGWELQRNAPVSGQATMHIKDIRWMSQFMDAGINLHGELSASAQLRGTLNRPECSARIAGNNLQVSFTELGILLPNGRLDAVIEGSQFRLNSLKFSQAIKQPPEHDALKDLPWLNQTGYFELTGAVDLRTGQGSIATSWQKFPFLQTKEAWLVASGQAQLAETAKTWNVTGQLLADAAYFSVPKQAAPKLSGDVVVLKKNDQRRSEKTAELQTSLDFSINTGKNFVFVGRGLDTRLDGEIRIRSKNVGTILSTGTIHTVGGTYEGYGQKLAIDRGILNFQGPIDNPGLNVRAMRRGLAVEAGVEVAGTVARPEVHLISEPNVPDPDKLSWMVLGRASDQMAGSEAALLMSAAGAIFGGENGSNIPSAIAHSFGLEGLSFGTASSSPGSQLPAQTVAGTINSTQSSDQVFSVGKRIAPNLVFSIERSLTDASNGLKLTWHLTRQFSIIGRAGNDTAIDGQYTFSFD